MTQEFDARKALMYWGRCHARRRVQTREPSARDKMRAILHGVPKSNHKAVIEAYLRNHREGFGPPVLQSDGVAYEPMSTDTYRLNDDPHPGCFIFLAVELCLLDMDVAYRALAVWKYVKDERVDHLPSPQTSDAKWKMHQRLVHRVEISLDKAFST